MSGQTWAFLLLDISWGMTDLPQCNSSVPPHVSSYISDLTTVEQSHPEPNRARSGLYSPPYSSRIETPARRPELGSAARRPDTLRTLRPPSVPLFARGHRNARPSAGWHGQRPDPLEHRSHSRHGFHRPAQLSITRPRLLSPAHSIPGPTYKSANAGQKLEHLQKQPTNGFS